MAIRMRRGEYEKFDPDKMLPGEWAVVLSDDGTSIDGRAVYMCTAAGSVKRMATLDDMAEVAANSNPEVFAAIRDSLAGAYADIADAEDARVDAERSRVTAEDARVTAEDARVAAEDARVAAEKSRVEAEKSRVEAMSGQYLSKADAASRYATKDAATSATDGLMSAADKAKLDGSVGNLPVYYYASKPDESAVPQKPSLVVVGDGSMYLVS